MSRSRRLLAVAALSSMALSCAKREEPRRISQEAAAAFGHVQTDGVGGTLVIDLDAARELGFKPAAGQREGGELLVDLAVALLPMIAADLKDEPAAASALARSAVLLRLLGEWATVPVAQRLGVLVRVDPAKPEEAADGALVLLAVREGEAQNRELLKGLGASIRAATGRDLVRTEQGYLCAAKEALPELPFQVCLSPGPGFFALGTPKALGALSTPAPAPAAREPGALLVARALVPGLGKVELTMDGKAAVRIAGRLEPEDPELAGKIQAGIQAGLFALDLQTQKQKTLTATAIGEVKGALEKDPEAPARLKAAAAAATPEKILDPRGDLDAIRKSVKVASTGKAVTAELTIPEGPIRRYAQLEQGLTTVTTVGVLAAIAIPNFLKYQCRAKATEGRMVLQQAWGAMEAKRSPRGKYPERLQQLALEPLPGGRYVVCMRSGCAAGATPAIEATCAVALASLEDPKAPALCAAGAIQGEDLDVWLVDASGTPREFHSACE